jgi:outer membrane lipoprotein-sorting protein
MMRWLLTLVVATLAVPVSAGENEAEKLFRQMEKKVKGAKTLQIRFEMAISVLGIEGNLKGTASFGESDKARLEAKGTIAGQEVDALGVATGTKIHLLERGSKDGKTLDSPKGLGIYFRGVVPRVGLGAALEDQDALADLPNVDDRYKISDFKLGGKEKIGDAETRIVEYAVLIKGKDKGTAKLWINTKTHLPAKLQIRAGVGGADIEITETYTEVTIDGKLDDKLFEAPK